MADQSKKYLPINLKDVRGGMNTALPAHDIADNEFVELRNMEYASDGELTTRPGTTAIPTAVTSVGLKGVINNFNLSSVQSITYDSDANLLLIVDSGTTDAVYIVDVENPEKPEFLGSCIDATYLAQPVKAVLHGDYLLVSDIVKKAVVVFDITDPGNPVYERSHVDATNLDYIHEIQRVGNYLYCAVDDSGGNGGVVVLDISDLGTGISESNKLQSHSGGKWLDIVPGTNRLYQTNDGTDELHIIDISTPTAISLVISFLDAVNLNNIGPVRADAGYVYTMSAFDDKLIVVDASNEAVLTIHATLTDSVRLNQCDKWLYKRGNLLVIPLYWSDAITLVNIANPSSPSIIADIQIPGRFDQMMDAVLVDSYIFCASQGDDYLMCLELQVPLPFQTLETDTGYTAQFDFIRATPDNRWVATYEHGASKTVYIFDRNDETEVNQVDFETNLGTTYFSSYTFDAVYDVTWNDTLNRFYVWCSLNAAGKGGLLTYSFNSSTGKIAWIATDVFDDGGGAGGCQFFPGRIDNKGYLAVACGTSSTDNILIIKVENDSPTKVGLNDTGLAAVPAKVQMNAVDEVFYVTTSTQLTVWDISDPASPVLHKTITDTDTEDIILQPNRQKLWGFDPTTATTIAEWDVTTPLEPVKKHAATFNLINIPSNWPWYDPNTEKLYLSSAADDAIYVVNVSSYPYILEYVYVDPVGLPESRAIHVKDEHVFSADNGLISIVRAEVQQSFNIVWEISRIPLDEAYGVRHYGQLLAVASKTSDAITLVDISEPASLVATGYVVDAVKLNGAVDLAWFGSGKYIIAACNTYGGCTIYDVSDPLDITEKSTITTSALTGCNSIVIDSDENFAYVASPGYLSVLDIRDPANVTLVAAVPDATKYALMDGLAFINDNYLCGVGTNYVNIWDIQLPFSPYLVGSLNDASQPAARVESDGTYIYATTNAGNSVRIYDASDVTAPVFDNEITGLTGAYGLKYIPVDKILWVGVPGLTKVSLYDVSTPTAPTLLDDLVDADNAVGSKIIDAAGFDVYVPCSTIDRVSCFRVVGMPFRSTITSIFQLKNEQGVDRLIITEGNHVLAQNETDSGVFEDIKGALKIPTDAKWRWAVLDGVLFGVHGAKPQETDDDGVVTEYGYPQVVYWDGESTSLQEVTSFPDQENACTQIELWNHRIFVLCGNSVYYSKLGDGTDFTHTTSGSLDVYPDDGDVSTGMKEHKGMLVIFKRKHIYRILAGVPNTADSKWSLELVTRNSGAISGESIQSVLDDLIFLSSEGLTTLGSAERLGDFETVLLSKKIADLRGLKLDTVRFPAVYWPAKSQYLISVDTDDDGVVDKTYVMDMKDALQQGAGVKWTYFDGAMLGTAFAIVEVGGYNELYIGSDDLYKLDTTKWTDGGVTYNTRIKTKEFDLDVPSNRKEILRWGISFVKRTAALTLAVDLYFDGNTTAVHSKSIDAAAATLNLPQFARTMVAGRRRFRRIQMEIDNTGDEAYDLESLYFELTPLTTKRARSV
jgi:hypothetical protein